MRPITFPPCFLYPLSCAALITPSGLQELDALFAASLQQCNQQPHGTPAPHASSTVETEAAVQAHAAAINEELFEFFSQQHTEQQHAAGGEQTGANQLSQHLASSADAWQGTKLQQHAMGHAPQGAISPSSNPPSRSNSSSSNSSSMSHNAGNPSTFAPTSRSSSNGRGGEEVRGLSHVDAAGQASMVDVSGKRPSTRSATAAARVLLGPEVYALVAGNALRKGDVLTVAKLAGGKEMGCGVGRGL
jgi:hypothetical protein